MLLVFTRISEQIRTLLKQSPPAQHGAMFVSEMANQFPLSLRQSCLLGRDLRGIRQTCCDVPSSVTRGINRSRRPGTATDDRTTRWEAQPRVHELCAEMRRTSIKHTHTFTTGREVVLLLFPSHCLSLPASPCFCVCFRSYAMRELLNIDKWTQNTIRKRQTHTHTHITNDYLKNF